MSLKNEKKVTKPNLPGLFDPLNLGPFEMANRIVMAPMTRNRAGDGNAPTELNAAYYGQRSGAGLILTEATQVSPQGIGYPNTPGIYTPEQIAGWRKVTDTVHQRGGRIYLQLFHVGRISHPSLQPDNATPVAPSAIRPAGQAFTYQGLQPYVTPRALATNEIPGVVTQFQRAAENAVQAGFDGIELHAANGYLIDQFLRNGTNKRTDPYGGPIEKRARFLFEVIDAVVKVWGNKRVGVRVSPLGAFNDMYDSNPEITFGYVVSRLNAYDLAYLHVIEGNEKRSPEFDLRTLREAYRGVYIANGGYDRERAEAAVKSGAADLVAFGKPFVANPDLPVRFARNAPLNSPDPATFYGGDEHGYTDYPALKGEAA
jgi:N-ethylmaleimide reductase